VDFWPCVLAIHQVNRHETHMLVVTAILSLFLDPTEQIPLAAGCQHGCKRFKSFSSFAVDFWPCVLAIHQVSRHETHMQVVTAMLSLFLDPTEGITLAAGCQHGRKSFKSISSFTVDFWPCVLAIHQVNRHETHMQVVTAILSLFLDPTERVTLAAGCQHGCKSFKSISSFTVDFRPCVLAIHQVNRHETHMQVVTAMLSLLLDPTEGITLAAGCQHGCKSFKSISSLTVDFWPCVLAIHQVNRHETHMQVVTAMLSLFLDPTEGITLAAGCQ
jgi:hypothetical protein